MATRLGHKKSRRGCLNCKKRKVKCDEGTPECETCQRRHEQCIYNLPWSHYAHTGFASVETPGVREARQAEAEVDLGPSTTDPDSLSETQDRRLLELYLLHHYTTVVAPSFPTEHGQPTGRPVYSVEAVRLAFQHDCLLSAIFAVSSLHIALEVVQNVAAPTDPTMNINSVREGSREDAYPVVPAFSHINFSQVYRVYLQSAIQSQRKALSMISASNIEALALTSILLSVIVMHLKDESSEASIANVAYHPPTQHLHFSLGIRSIFATARALSVQSRILSNLLSADSTEYSLGSSDVASPFESAIQPFSPILNFQKQITRTSTGAAPQSNISINSRTTSTFLPLPSTLESGSATFLDTETTIFAFSQTISLLGSIHAAFLRSEPPYQLSRRLTAFLALVPPAYLLLLESMHPCALVIFAHYIAMTVPLERHYWFFRGLAEREIRGVAGILPKEWEWAMAWPWMVCEKRDVVGEWTAEVRKSYESAGRARRKE